MKHRHYYNELHNMLESLQLIIDSKVRERTIIARIHAYFDAAECCVDPEDRRRIALKGLKHDQSLVNGDITMYLKRWANEEL